MPEARPLEAVREDKDVKNDLAAGAFLLAAPLISLTGRTTKANITMDAGLLAAIDQIAKSRGLTRSAFLADLARREIEGKHAPRPLEEEAEMKKREPLLPITDDEVPLAISDIKLSSSRRRGPQAEQSSTQI